MPNSAYGSPALLSGLTTAPVRSSSTAATSFTSTTPAAFDAASNLTLAASANDWIEVGVQCRCDTSAGNYLIMDVGTLVSAAIVHYFASRTSTIGDGLTGILTTSASTDVAHNASMVMQLAAGDINSAGNVVLQIMGCRLVGTGTARVTAGTVLYFYARNLGAPVATAAANPNTMFTYQTFR